MKHGQIAEGANSGSAYNFTFLQRMGQVGVGQVRVGCRAQPEQGRSKGLDGLLREGGVPG